MRLFHMLAGVCAMAGCASGEPSPAAPPTAEERVWLLQMREEEKLAHDVYLHFAAHGVPFTHIVRSESRHEQVAASLLASRGIADPVAGLPAGRFATRAMQDLYDTLTARGAASRSAALAVGAEIEELDIADLRKARAQSGSADIRTTFENLELASRNHLRAFSANLRAAGAAYEPKHLAAADFAAIAAGQHEDCGEAGCGSSCGGTGQGPGAGPGGCGGNGPRAGAGGQGVGGARQRARDGSGPGDGPGRRRR